MWARLVTWYDSAFGDAALSGQGGILADQCGLIEPFKQGFNIEKPSWRLYVREAPHKNICDVPPALAPHTLVCLWHLLSWCPSIRDQVSESVRRPFKRALGFLAAYRFIGMDRKNPGSDFHF